MTILFAAKFMSRNALVSVEILSIPLALNGYSLRERSFFLVSNSSQSFN